MCVCVWGGGGGAIDAYASGCVALQMLNGGELNNGEVRVNVASDVTEGGGASLESVRLLGNATGQKNEAPDLVDFVRDKTLWSQQAQWTRSGGVIAGVVQTVATSNIIPELESPLLDPSLGSEGAAELPRVVKIMLDLMQRSDLELKAASSAFLIRIFRHRTAVRCAIQQVVFICDKSMAITHRTLRDLISDFRLHSRHISSRKGEQSSYDGLHQTQEGGDAFERCTAIFEQMTGLLQSKGPDESHLTQRLIASLGFHREAVSLLLQAHQNSKLGSTTELGAPEIADLLNAVYRFLASLCSNNKTLQQDVVRLLACDASVAQRENERQGTGNDVDLIKTHVQMEGMHPEPLMQVILSQNNKLNSLLGREWGRFIVTTFNPAFVTTPKGVQRLKVLSSVVRCHGRPIKEFQDLVRALVQGDQQLLSTLMSDDVCFNVDWEHGRLHTVERWLLETQAAFLTLLSDLCEENPASVLFVERLLPFNWVVKTSILVVVCPLGRERFMGDSIDGDALALSARVQGALLSVLRRVYMGLHDEEISPELFSSGNGIWSLDDEHQVSGDQKTLALIPALAVQLSSFADALADWPVEQVKECLRFSVSFLRDYYMIPALRLPERALQHNLETAGKIWDALHTLTKKGAGIFKHMDRDEQAELRTKSVALMNCMVQNGSVERQVLLDVDEEAEPQAVDLSASVSECLRAGFERFCDDIDEGLRGTERPYMLPWLLSTDEDVSIYEDVSQSEGNAITNPRMPMLVIECLAVLRPGADDQLLLDWLSILRGAMYLSDPINAGKASNISASIARSLSLADDGSKKQLIEARWGAFTGLSSILLAQAGDRRMLAWVQSKFNAIGCTHVALRLCSHENVAVQMQARLLLIALLECSNTAVQTEIAVYFKTHKRCDFFRVAHEVLEAAKNSLKDHKRLLKHSTRFKFDVKKRARELARQRKPVKVTNLLSSNLVAFDGMMASQSELVRIGRDSHVMVLLRQLELMCSAQHAGLQDLMQKQSSPKTYNLLRACTLLVRAVQGLELAKKRDQDISPFLALQTQLLATVCRMSEGPNVSNQREILESSLFSDVNRIFATVYIFSPSAQVTAEVPKAQRVKHLNGLIQLLKMEALKLCLSFFDSVLAADVPRSMIGFFEVTNLVSQMLNNSKILGLLAEGKYKYKMDVIDDNEYCWNDGKIDWDDLFTEGYRERLRAEMLAYYHLLQYFKRFVDGDEVSRHLKEIKEKYPTLQAYLKGHTCNVEVARYVSVSASGVPTVVNREVSSKKHKRQVDKVFFPVSEGMVRLVESKGFKVKWHDVIWNLPHTKLDEKHTELIAKMRHTLAMATWLQTVAATTFGRFLIRHQETLRIVQFRLSILITLCLVIFYGLPVDPNSGELLADGNYHPGPFHYGGRSRPPAGYEMNIPYPYANQTSGTASGSMYQIFSSFYIRHRLTLWHSCARRPTRGWTHQGFGPTQRGRVAGV
jgi:hypothetical protein